MIKVSNNQPERAILVALNTREQNKDILKEHLAELEELALTAGAFTEMKIVQDKFARDPAYYIGKGKAQEISFIIKEKDIDLVIFDDDLSPVQVRNLEKLFERKIVDRSGLILDIFASRAKTNEAKTQVELAQLQYMLPRLTRAWTHLSKQYGGIGTKGPGETQIETDRRIIRSRISHLKEKLQKIELQRETQSAGRKNYLQVSIVGYTNAGKSTLFNLLTQAGVFAEDKLFATLDSTTRSIEIKKNQKLLISDTVGFIRKLPPNLVASFKSTLNEVRNADLIFHVVDMSNPYFEDHIKVVEQTLSDIESNNKPVLLIFNKIDVVEDKNRIDYLRNKYDNCVIISAQRGINIGKMKDKLLNMIENNIVKENIALKLNDSKIAAKIHSLAEVLSTEFDDNSMNIVYKTNKENSDKIKKLISDNHS